VGPGTYHGPFTYTGADPVHVIGAGTVSTGPPVLTAPPTGATVLKLDGGGNGNTVDALQLRIPVANGAVGLHLDGKASHISVTNPSGTAATTGVWLVGDSTLADSNVGVGSLSIAVYNAAVIGSVTDSSLAGYDGIDSQSGQLTASDIDITTSGFGILGTGQ